MKKSDIKNLPEYFDYYINLIEDVSLEEAFDQSIKQIDDLDMEKWQRIGLKVYAEGKWTLNKIIQHITDWERIWAYRTLLSIRNTGTMPPGLDHNLMADYSNADSIELEKLITELREVRKATKAMFSTFNQKLLVSDCHFNNNKMSTLAMGFNIIGHQIHHFNVVNDKYFPLLEE